MLRVRNLDQRTSRWARVAVIALAIIGVCIIALVRWVMLKAGASAYLATNAVFFSAVLYSILAYVVLAKRIGAYNRRIDTGSNIGRDSGVARRGKLRILSRLLLQASLFCLGSWLLIRGSPDMGDLGRFPFSVRLLIVLAALCLLIWRVICARRLLAQADRQANEVGGKETRTTPSV